MNVGVHVSFQINVFVFFGNTLRSRLLDHMVTLFLVFWGTSILFSIVAAPIYIPTNSVQGSLFSTPSSAFVICGLFDDSHLTSVRWCLIVVLICISLMITVAVIIIILYFHKHLQHLKSASHNLSHNIQKYFACIVSYVIALFTYLDGELLSKIGYGFILSSHTAHSTVFNSHSCVL